MKMKNSHIEVDAPIPFNYLELGNEKSEKNLLILHGFAQNNEQILDELVKKLDPSISENYRIFIPNGIFPIPKIRREGIKYRYSWYFFDGSRQEYYVDMITPMTAIMNFFKQLELKEVIVVGYSQGGYLAPILASHCSIVSETISLNANTRVDKLGPEKNFKHTSIHNEGDPTVECENSYKSYEALKEIISEAEYFKLPVNTHEITQESISIINDLLEI